jgi:hypothetical protein
MPLDPHAKKLLEMLNAAGAADVSRMAPDEMREGFERLAAMVGVNGVAVDAAEDRALPGPGGPIPVRVYAPKGSGAAALPGLIYFHGGGGVFGSINSHDSLCRALANAGACRVVSVGYRLAPEHRTPSRRPAGSPDRRGTSASTRAASQSAATPSAAGLPRWCAGWRGTAADRRSRCRSCCARSWT